MTKTGFRLIILAVFITGIIFRAAGGVPLLWKDIIYSAGSKLGELKEDSPENVIHNFFVHLDRGDYDLAWELTNLDELGFSEDFFISESMRQIGRSGLWVEIRDLEITDKRIYDGKTEYRVHGKLVSACSVFSFNKTIEIINENVTPLISSLNDGEQIKMKELFSDLTHVYGNRGELW
jgi:hypothetical protein